MMIPALMIFLFVFLLLGMPIYVSLGLGCFLSLIFFSDGNPVMLIQQFFAGIDAFGLMALPFFILAANLMDTGGLSSRILNVARALVGHVTGGMAMTTQLASMFFGALSGSSPATVMAIGKVMNGELRRSGYSKSFISGLLASSGSVSLIIPPSITLIIYATAVPNVSVGKLFMAGLGAGIVYGLASVIYIYVYSRKNNIPRDKRVSSKELIHALIDAAWALMIPVIILGGIYSGFCTATEAAGISAVYAAVIGLFVYKELTFKTMIKACANTARSCGEILVLVAAAKALGWMLIRAQVPQMVTGFIADNITSQILFLLLVNIVLLIMGMFMEGVAAIIIVAPLIYPAAVALGVDPIHLGTIMISNLAIGMFTPPFGMNIFVTSSITKADMVEMLPGIARFFIVDLIALMLITYIPQISLFLPNLLK